MTERDKDREDGAAGTDELREWRVERNATAPPEAREADERRPRVIYEADEQPAAVGADERTIEDGAYETDERTRASDAYETRERTTTDISYGTEEPWTPSAPRETMTEDEMREPSAEYEAYEPQRESDSQEAHEPLDDAAMNAMIEEICNSKADEFHMIGYDSITGKDVWDCVSSKYKELPPLHRVVNDILSLRPTNLMNWMTLSVWKQSERNPMR